MAKYAVYVWKATHGSENEVPRLKVLEKWEGDSLRDICAFLKNRKIPFCRVNTRKLGESKPEDFLMECSRLYHQPAQRLWRLLYNGEFDLAKESPCKEDFLPTDLEYALILFSDARGIPKIYNNRIGYAVTSEDIKDERKYLRRNPSLTTHTTYRCVKHRANQKKTDVWMKSEMKDYLQIDALGMLDRMTGEVENQMKQISRKPLHASVCSWDLYEKKRSRNSRSWKNQKKKHQYL